MATIRVASLSRAPIAPHGSLHRRRSFVSDASWFRVQLPRAQRMGANLLHCKRGQLAVALAGHGHLERAEPVSTPEVPSRTQGYHKHGCKRLMYVIVHITNLDIQLFSRKIVHSSDYCFILIIKTLLHNVTNIINSSIHNWFFIDAIISNHSIHQGLPNKGL